MRVFRGNNVVVAVFFRDDVPVLNTPICDILTDCSHPPFHSSKLNHAQAARKPSSALLTTRAHLKVSVVVVSLECFLPQAA